ncbi:hypothetical protein ACNKHR_01810 [Shigella flexneri]
MMSRGPPGKKRAHWSSVICRSVLRLIIMRSSPAANTALEGLYQSGDALCTQCEAEGFRHITYYLRPPDVLAHFTAKLSRDKIKYPFLLSNGNRIGKANWKTDAIG